MKNKMFSGAMMNLILQLSLVISGLIVPNLIINTYGSEVNGMISSINQLLSYITLLESGIGGVIKAELYKPLLEKDEKAIGGIVNATSSFFKKIGYVFVVYLLGIATCFYYISPNDMGYSFSFWLVIVLGISIISQYFIGITYQTLLQADQNYSFTSSVQVVTLWLNVVCSVLLIHFGASIHIVKLVTALLFAIRPFCYLLYVKNHYKIDYSVGINKNALAQRWDGFGHHIAYFIHTNTDIVLITIFLNLKEVSVYSIYLMVVTGVRSFIAAISSAVEPYLGRLIAQKDENVLQNSFSIYELCHFLISAILFGATIVLIIPFVSIYSRGVSDVNYVRPLFAILMIAAEGVYCLRNPYSSIVFASGHFKQTKTGAYIEAIINITISLFLVKKLGITGVAIGTLVAMLFRTIQYVVYLSKYILQRSIVFFIKRMVLLLCSICLTTFIFSLFDISVARYDQWILYALVVTAVSSVVSFCIFALFSFKDIKNLCQVFGSKKGACR